MVPVEFQRALTDLRAVRRQLAEHTEFQGYGPRTLAVSAGIAIMAGVAQSACLPDPKAHPWPYAMLWLSVAVACAALIATEMLARTRRLHGEPADTMVWSAVQQFLPAGVAGAVLPLVLLRSAPEFVCLLPGLWQVLFSLGVFACCRSLPRAMVAVGAWFLVAGLMSLALSPARALSPFTMAGAFSIGMTLVSVIHARAGKTVPDVE